MYYRVLQRACNVFVIAALLHACSTTPVQLEFDVRGGDAWTFDKPVSGRIAAGVCEEVRLRIDEQITPAVVTDSRFLARAPLYEGENRVRAQCLRDGRVVEEEAQYWTVRLEDRPIAWVRARIEDGAVVLNAERSQPAHRTPAPIVRYEWSARASNPAPLSAAPNEQALSELEGAVATLAAPSTDGDYFVDLRIVDALGRTDTAATMFRVESGQAQRLDLDSEHPAWVDRAVVYGVVPFFFGAAGFDAVRARLDAIAALGANVIWLSPINEAAPDDFGYAVTDHFRLRAAFGAEAAFRALIDAAHARGLKVLMDFVPNHVSDQHRYFLDAQRFATRSAYFGWFERDADGEPTHYFDWRNLKNLDYDDPEVRAYVVAAFAYWVREFGVDGFRVDASWGVRERAPDFWPEWREALKRIDPDLFLLAEASARDGYYVQHGFDAAYDWTDQLGVWAWRDVFGEGGEPVDVELLRHALTNDREGFPLDTLAFRFLNNNDTGARFITRHGPALTRLAAVMLFTTPGVPLIYNGDEVGAEFEPYDEGPPIEWRDPHDLTPHYTKLAHLRRSTPALHGRTLELIATTHERFVLAYRRPASGGEDLWVLLNFSPQPLTVRFTEEIARPRSGEYRDLLTGESGPLSRQLQLGGLEARVLRLERG